MHRASHPSDLPHNTVTTVVLLARSIQIMEPTRECPSTGLSASSQGEKVRVDFWEGRVGGGWDDEEEKVFNCTPILLEYVLDSIFAELNKATIAIIKLDNSVKNLFDTRRTIFMSQSTNESRVFLFLFLLGRSVFFPFVRTWWRIQRYKSSGGSICSANDRYLSLCSPMKSCGGADGESWQVLLERNRRQGADRVLLQGAASSCTCLPAKLLRNRDKLLQNLFTVRSFLRIIFCIPRDKQNVWNPANFSKSLGQRWLGPLNFSSREFSFGVSIAMLHELAYK